MNYLHKIPDHRKKLFLLFALNLFCFNLFAQSPLENELANKVDNYNKIMPLEKLFLQTDKPSYSATDTIWFKAYLFNGLNNTYSPLSGLIYVELIANAKVVRRISVPVNIGLSWGQLPLDEDTFKDGEYTLRAYTNWMKNFGEETFFTKQIYIKNLQNQVWLINQKQNLANLNGKQVDNIDLTVKDLNQVALVSKKLSWRVQQGESVVTSGNAQTTMDGKLKVDFNLPEKIKTLPLKLFIEDNSADQKTVVPIQVNRPGNIDLQFMPEGGYLLAGVRSKVGFKALAENGLGTDVEGTVVDSKGNSVIPFKSAYKGMGTLTFEPLPGEVYTAKVKLADGSVKTFDLPKVKASGVSLRVINTKENDSVHVIVNITQDLVKGQTYQLVGQVNNVIYGQASFAASQPRVSLVLAKNTFPSGIVHFTVFNNQNQPVSERATFVYNNDNLNIVVKPSKANYKTRDSIALHIDLKDKSGTPVPAASLSVAVTDNNQIHTDTLENNLVSDILLTSGLKGNVEEPGYYFSDVANAADNLDLLLLTQGWTSYNWDEILKPQPVALFKPEGKFSLSGNVTNFTGKPIAGSKVLLMMGGKVRMIADTLTNAEGKFMFKQLPKFDTASFFVQVHNLNGKKGNIAVQLDEFRPAPLQLLSPELISKWYVNSDAEALVSVKDEMALRKKKYTLNGNNVLNDVVITGQKGVKNSHNLNGTGQADQVIDEAQIAAAGGVPLLTFLTRNIKGLYLKATRTDHEFYIMSRKVNFVVDGMDVRTLFASTDSVMSYDDLVTELNDITIKDVTGVEVMVNDNNVTSYNSRLTNDPEANFGKNAYVEITTRSGKGLIVKSKQNIASYQPIPVNWPKEFYSPRYTANNIKTDVLDTRSTIFWQPHLSMSKAGDAQTSFYAADKPGIYTVIIQGSNLKGLVGYKRVQIKVN